MASRHVPFLVLALLLVPAFASPAQGAATNISWGADLSQWLSVSDAARTEAISSSMAAGMRVIAVDAKDGGGIGWSTPSYAPFRPMAPGEGAVELVTRDAHQNGMKVVARFDAFWDSGAAERFPYAAIGGGTWVDPACSDVRAYVLGQVKDLVARTQIDEINFDHVRYPETADAPGSAWLPCTGGRLDQPGAGADRISVISTFVEEASAAARSVRPSIVVSASIYAGIVDAPMQHIGQDADALARSVDILRPMLYPTYLGSEETPYATVHSWTAKYVAKFGSERTQPWVQAFYAYSARPDILGEELRAVRDAGGSSALVWWFWSAGTAPAFWMEAASALGPVEPSPVEPTPTEPAPTEPSPTDAPFEATFDPSAAGRRTLGVDIDANEALDQVTVTVDGKRTYHMSENLDNTWLRSMKLRDGMTLRFTATSADGDQAHSRTFTWPVG